MFIVKAKNIAMVTVEPVKKKPVENMTDQLKKMAIDTEEEIQEARTRRGRNKLSENSRVDANKLRRSTRTRKKRGMNKVLPQLKF